MSSGKLTARQYAECLSGVDYTKFPGDLDSNEATIQEAMDAARAQASVGERAEPRYVRGMVSAHDYDGVVQGYQEQASVGDGLTEHERDVLEHDGYGWALKHIDSLTAEVERLKGERERELKAIDCYPFGGIDGLLKEIEDCLKMKGADCQQPETCGPLGCILAKIYHVRKAIAAARSNIAPVTEQVPAPPTAAGRGGEG